MRPQRLTIVAAAVGLVLGLGTAQWVLVGSWASLIPWALAGLIVGVAAPDATGAARAGAVYGAVLVVSFVVGGRSGDFSQQWLTFVPFTTVLAAIGIGCGCILSSLGRRARTRLQSQL